MKKSKRTFNKVLSLLLAVLMLAGMTELGLGAFLSLRASATMEDPAALNGMLKVNSNGDFKILQVADLQDHAEADGQTNIEFRSINMIKIAVARLKPDLVVFTGDNIYQHENSHDRDDKYIKDDFLYSAQIVIDALDGTPFAVTYGNHDVERNAGLSLKDQQAIYDKLGAVKLCQDGLTITDTSDNSTSKYGTGYIDVYSNDGSKVVERVIILNSGTYENGTGYDGVGFGRPGLNATTYQNYDYNNIVNAVNKWTSNPEIKCVGYQHIQLREMFDADTPLLIQGGTVNSNTTKKFYPPSYGKTWQPNPAANPTGEYLEPCGCSGASTRELFNAYAKSNVVGVFFGHDHSNTVCGTVTAGGRSLYMGYGGGMDMYSDYAEDLPNGWGYDPRNSFYTVNANGTLTKDNLTYYKLLRDWNYSEYGSDQTYISEVRLFASDITINGNVTFSQDAFNDAIGKCLNAGYIPLETAYNRNKDQNGNGAYSVSGFPATVYKKDFTADFNFDCYFYDTQASAKTVVLGYKTTNNPAEAITDIRIGQSTSGKNNAMLTQNLSATVNNASADSGIMNTYSCGHGINPSTTGTQTVTYYNANYNWSWNGTTGTSQGVRADGLVKFNQGLDYAGDSWDTYLFYTKNPVAGLPVSRIFVDITGEHYSSSSATRPELTFNKNRYPQEYPYTWTQAFSGNVDYDRNNLAFNVKCGAGYDDFYFKADNQDASNIGVGYTYHVHGNSSKVERSCSAHIGLVRALPTGKSMTITKPTGQSQTVTGPTIIVPDTIYLKASDNKTEEFYLNNKTDGTAASGTSTTGSVYFNGAGVSGSITATLKDGSTTLKTLTLTNGTAQSFSGIVLVNAMTQGTTKNLTWEFSYNGKTAKAYTTVYAPSTNTVAAGTVTKSKWRYDNNSLSTWSSDQYHSTTTVIWGLNGASTQTTSSTLMYVGNSYYQSTKNSNIEHDNAAKFYPSCDPIVNPSYAAVAWHNEGYPSFRNTTSNGMQCSYDKYSGGGTTIVSWLGSLTVDTSRFSTFGQIPNLGMRADWGGSSTTQYSSDYLFKTRKLDATQTYSAMWYTLSGSFNSANTVKESGSIVSSTKNSTSAWSNTANFSSASISGVDLLAIYSHSNIVTNEDNNVQSVSMTQVNKISKADLRAKVEEAVVKQKSDSTYQTALSNAALVLGNPAATSQQIASAIQSLDNAINGISVDYSKVTVNYKSSSSKVLDTVKQSCFYNDTVAVQVRNYNGYTAPSAPSAWTASAATKTFDLTYTLNNYTITFDSCGGSTVSSINYNIEQTLAYGSSQTISNQLGGNITIPAASSLSGHTFKGWKVAEASANSNWLKGTIYQAGDVTGYKYGNVTLVAVWDNCELKIDSNGGKTQNNLIYFANGASTASASNANMDAFLSYEADGDVCISGSRYKKDSGETTISPIAYVHLEAGKKYQISYTPSNNQTEFFIWTPDGKHCNMGTSNHAANQNYVSAEFQPGVAMGDSGWASSTSLTGEYYFRLDQNGYVGNGTYTIKDLKIVEVTEDKGVDNVIKQESGSERVIQNPVREGYTFLGWYTSASGTEVAPNMVNNNNGTYTYTYNTAAQTIYAQWVRSVVTLDSLASEDILDGSGLTVSSITPISGDTSKLNVTQSGKIISYTPNSMTWTAPAVYNVKLSNNATYPLTIYPQTTILYEETKGTADPLNTDAAYSWHAVSNTVPTGTIVKSGVYGYSNGYDKFSQYSNGTALKTTVSEGEKVYPTYTFTFTGTGVDIINTCDKDSGLMLIELKDSSGNRVGKNKAINTHCTKTIGQEVVYHEMNLPYDSYTVTVTAVYSRGFDLTDKTAQAGYDTVVPENGSIVDFSDILGEEYAECEYFCMDNGEYRSGNDEIVDFEPVIVKATTGTGHYDVTIDGVRVYNPGDTMIKGLTDQYTRDNELEPTYVKLLDIIQENGIEPNGTMYVEGDKDVEDDWNWTNVGWSKYIPNGSNTEVELLPSNTAVAFNVKGAERIHISLRSPLGKPCTAVINNTNIVITSTTEQYYDITDLVNAQGNIAIFCQSDDEDAMLAVCSVKYFGASVSFSAPEAALQNAKRMFAAMPQPKISDMSFNLSFGEAGSAVAEVTAEKFSVQKVGAVWTATTELSNEDVLALFAKTENSRDYTLNDESGVTLTATYVDGVWVPQDVTFAVTEKVPEADETMTFTVNFGDKGSAQIQISKNDIVVEQKDGIWIATVNVSNERLAQLLKEAGYGDEYKLNEKGDITLSATRVGNEWQAEEATVSVQELTWFEQFTAAIASFFNLVIERITAIFSF